MATVEAQTVIKLYVESLRIPKLIQDRMAFDDPFSVADQYYHSHSQEDRNVSDSSKVILIALSLISLALAALTIGIVVKKEREENERTKNR
jgi:hypothetical protein